MDLENFLSLIRGGQIHEKDFVQAPFAQQFGRQLRNVVGRGDDKYRRGFLRKPGQKCSKNARGRAAVASNPSPVTRRKPCQFRPPRESPARRIRPPRWRGGHFLPTNPRGCRTSGPCRSAAAAIAINWKRLWRKGFCRSPAHPASRCLWARAGRRRGPRW